MSSLIYLFLMFNCLLWNRFVSLKEAFFSSFSCTQGRVLCSDKLRKSLNCLLTNFNYLQVVTEYKKKKNQVSPGDVLRFIFFPKFLGQ